MADCIQILQSMVLLVMEVCFVPRMAEVRWVTTLPISSVARGCLGWLFCWRGSLEGMTGPEKALIQNGCRSPSGSAKTA